jgi:hypothetical protein
MKAKYKGKGGDCMFRIRRDNIRKQKKLDRQQNRMDHKKDIPFKDSEGYIFTYKADISISEVDSAKFRNVKLVPYLNIYSKKNNPFEVSRILYNIRSLKPREELKGLHYKLTGVTKLDNKRFIEIRQTHYWDIEKRDIPDSIEITTVGNGTNKQDVETYILFTTVSYLRHLKNKRIVTKKATLKKDVRKPYIRLTHRNNDKLKLVCITDGTSVNRVKKYEAEKLIKDHPSLSYCSKLKYTEYQTSLSKPTKKIQAQGQMMDKGGDIGKQITDPRTRRERRFVKQKQRKFSRYFTSQFVTGLWVTDPKNPNFEIFEETGMHKRIRHRIRPELFTKPFYNPAKRKKAVEQVKVEKPYVGITISKFPYNKPVVVNYTYSDKEGVVHHPRIENVKMINKNIIKEEPIKRKTKDGALVDDIEQKIICPIKDVEDWMNQEDFHVDKEGNIDSTKWIPYIKVENKTRISYKRPEFHLPKKNKKIKTWHNPDGTRKITPKVIIKNRPNRSEESKLRREMRRKGLTMV